MALLCNEAARPVNVLSRLSNVLNVDIKLLLCKVSYFRILYCSIIILAFCSNSETEKNKKMQFNPLKHNYTSRLYSCI